MSIRTFIVIIGAALALVGFILGIRTHSLEHAGPQGVQVSCGSAFAPDNADAKLADDGSDFAAALRGREETNTGAQSKCADLTGNSGLFWAMLAAGAVAIVGGLTVNRQTKPGAGVAS